MFVCLQLSPPSDGDNICLSERTTALFNTTQSPLPDQREDRDVATHLEPRPPGVVIKLVEGKKIFTTCLSKM